MFSGHLGVQYCQPSRNKPWWYEWIRTDFIIFNLTQRYRGFITILNAKGCRFKMIERVTPSKGAKRSKTLSKKKVTLSKGNSVKWVLKGLLAKSGYSTDRVWKQTLRKTLLTRNQILKQGMCLRMVLFEHTGHFAKENTSNRKRWLCSSREWAKSFYFFRESIFKPINSFYI